MTPPRLDPTNSPLACWVGAVADYNLERLDEAERGVRFVLRLDPKQNAPPAPSWRWF